MSPESENVLHKEIIQRGEAARYQAAHREISLPKQEESFEERMKHVIKRAQ